MPTPAPKYPRNKPASMTFGWQIERDGMAAAFGAAAEALILGMANSASQSRRRHNLATTAPVRPTAAKARAHDRGDDKG